VQFLNHPNTTCGKQEGKKDFCITDLASYVEEPEVTDAQPDYRFKIGFMNYQQTMQNVFGDGIYEHFMSLIFCLFFLIIFSHFPHFLQTFRTPSLSAASIIFPSLSRHFHSSLSPKT
jgi:hypothetical protein